MMLPVLKYPGAKWRLANWIISYMPPHESYLEPYFGSGGVFFNKPKSRVETINDIDGAIVQFFRTCRESPEELAQAIAMTPWAREEFLLSDFLDDAPPSADIERARQFAVRCWMTFGARTRCKTGWRHSTGKTVNGGPDNPKLWRRLPNIVYQVADRLMDAQIYNRPAVDVIAEYNGNGVLLYCDPPYVKHTRTLNGDQYRYEMTNQDHEELLSSLTAHKGMVILSGYTSPMYMDTLKDWTVVRTNTTAERGVPREECLWLNPAIIQKNNMQVSLLPCKGDCDK